MKTFFLVLAYLAQMSLIIFTSAGSFANYQKLIEDPGPMNFGFFMASSSFMAAAIIWFIRTFSQVEKND